MKKKTTSIQGLPLIVLLPFVGVAQGATFNISPADNLQATVNAAVNGDCITMAAGSYNDVIDLGSKQLLFEGAGIDQTIITANFLSDTVIRGSGIGSDMGGLIIRDLTIQDGNTPNGGTGVGYPFDGGGLVLANSTVSLENVKFTNNHTDDDGGGLYVSNCDTTIINCEFDSNTASGSGAGLLAVGGTIDVDDTTFFGNITTDGVAEGDGGWGGAMYLVQVPTSTFTGCHFEMNSATRGGVSRNSEVSPTFSGCMFINNEATEGFGGMFYSNTSGTLTIEDSMAMGNSAGSEGGAIYNNAPNVVLRRTTFRDNTSPTNGGAIYHLIGGTLTVEDCRFYANSSGRGGAIRSDRPTTIDSCLFVGNESGNFGAALYSTSTLLARHCTFVSNASASLEAVGGGNAVDAALLNCVAWGNTPVDSPFVLGNDWSATYSNIEQSDPMSVVAGIGNINGDPSFVQFPSPGMDMMWGTEDDDFGDLHLQSNSANIDAGDSQSVLDMLTDLDGLVRNLNDPNTPNTGISTWEQCVDMGGFEFQPGIAGPFCEGDADGSGVVNFSDITSVLGNWLEVCP